MNEYHADYFTFTRPLYARVLANHYLVIDSIGWVSEHGSIPKRMEFAIEVRYDAGVDADGSCSLFLRERGAKCSFKQKVLGAVHV